MNQIFRAKGKPRAADQQRDISSLPAAIGVKLVESQKLQPLGMANQLTIVRPSQQQLQHHVICQQDIRWIVPQLSALIELFLCRTDNFGVLLHDTDTGRTAAVDAPEVEAIEAALTRRGWRLTDILVTHHHEDHVAGIESLKASYGCRVVAAKEMLQEVRRRLQEEERQLADLRGQGLSWAEIGAAKDSGAVL